MFKCGQVLVIPLIGTGLLTLSSCKTTIDTSGLITSASLTATSVGTISGTTVTITAPSGYAYESVTLDLGSQFLATNICSTASILGVTGTASCSASGTSTVVTNESLLRSNMYRTVASTQITQIAETTTYAGSGSSANLSTSLTNYREIPNIYLDDEGYCTADVGACAGNQSPIVSITWTQHTGFTNCGTTQTTIAARIADCASKNGSTATWNGATKGTSGEGQWSLVTRMTPTGVCTVSVASCVPKEVWRDETTGLLWSSIVANTNWCLGAGNSQAADAATCGSASYQPSTESFCAEGSTSVVAAGTCSVTTCPGSGLCVTSGLCTGNGGTWTATTENWAAGTYSSAKGGMGANSSPGVRWRLPTVHDYEQADVDGIRFVMPDMGALNTTTQGEWSSTVYSASRTSARAYQSDSNLIASVVRTSARVIRCVGR